MLMSNIIFILYKNQVGIVKISKYECNFFTFCHRFWKNWFSQQQSRTHSNRYILLFAVDWRFERYMKVGKMFSNKGVDRFARARGACVSCLHWSILLQKKVVTKCTQSYVDILTFWCWIRINSFQNVRKHVKRWNLKFSWKQRFSLTFSGARGILRISQPKRDRNRLKRRYS